MSEPPTVRVELLPGHAPDIGFTPETQTIYVTRAVNPWQLGRMALSVLLDAADATGGDAETP